MNDNRAIKRGDVYYADLKEQKGSIQAGIRPVVITQYNGLNRYSPTVVVAAITSQLKKLDAPYHVMLPVMKGLPKRSMVLAEQRFTLNKSDLIEYRCTLDKRVMRAVTEALNASEKGDGGRRHASKKN